MISDDFDVVNNLNLDKILFKFVILIDRKIWPSTNYERIMVMMVGVLGGLTMLTTFACVKFMPVGDAMTLIFTNPLFTMLFAACFMGHRLSTLKIISSKYLLQLSKLHDSDVFIYIDYLYLFNKFFFYSRCINGRHHFGYQTPISFSG